MHETCEKSATCTDWGFHLIGRVSLVPPVSLGYPAGACPVVLAMQAIEVRLLPKRLFRSLLGP